MTTSSAPQAPRVILCITWQDAVKRDGIYKVSEVLDVVNGHTLDYVELETVGWLVSKSGKTITIARDYDPQENEWRDLTHIPIGMIQGVKKFRLTPKPNKKITRRQRLKAGKT